MEWVVQVSIYNSILSLKVDTGAQINVICQDDLVKLSPTPDILPQNISLKSYQGDKIPCLGICNLTIRSIKGDILAPFAVVPHGLGFHSVLGLSTAMKLGILGIPQGDKFTRHQLQVNAIQNQEVSPRVKPSVFGENIRQAVLQKYPRIFEVVGSFGEPYSIALKPEYTPVVNPVRRVPFLKKKANEG